MAVASQQKRYDSYGWLDMDSTKLVTMFASKRVEPGIYEVAPSGHQRLPSAIVHHLLVVASTRSGV